MSPNPLEIVVGLALLFFLPGYGLTRATFPDWRIRGPPAALRLLETLTLSLFGSVAVAVLAGYLLLRAGPTGFQAYWSEPWLEGALALVAAVGLGIGGYRGAFARIPPAAPVSEPEGETDPWATVRALDDLRRQERRLRHELRAAERGSPEAARLERDIDRVRTEVAEVAARREAEYAS